MSYEIMGLLPIISLKKATKASNKDVIAMSMAW